MRFGSLIAGVCFLAALASGCRGEKRPPAAAVAPPPATETTSTTELSGAVLPRQVPVSPSVTVSEEISRTCQLPLGNVQSAPKFAFDESDLALADYEMLQLISQCLSTGPLAGRTVMLTGRADTLGTEDYNMALGARRANTVATYLGQFGVKSAQLQETSRGELDATGTDAAERQIDRRVDITLK
ncbi:MAG: OmpA family protein [Labilithrix sp.]|nr:OmpA family protein [Labilithrix sp.]MCW5815758.1 OmpA family protein [Labilithrix sp.]